MDIIALHMLQIPLVFRSKSFDDTIRDLFCCLMLVLNELNAECAIALGPLNTSQGLQLRLLLH